eukprot:CAMPEP_0174270752 /NCGR_PEP_ID=MMETSP0439-20130205/45609_1 /TAXON_ID=0 /ORGANISM="Stereomyxa ramosa, Strain Chinc5" /LENGTH=222 /DNA_ID=CAMNT_0015360275 /DNA_START=179 /DNA_END=844 /DNA_ORIENTATION=+
MVYGISDSNKNLLREDGWKVVEVPRIKNQLMKSYEYDSGIFTKLQLWNQTDYDKVIFLDADTLVLKNIDHLFNCGDGMCAYLGRPMKSMFNFNVGVMVVKPSTELLEDMLEMVPILRSNRLRLEAGFLNIYFLHWCTYQSTLVPLPSSSLRTHITTFAPTPYEENKPKRDPVEPCESLELKYNHRIGKESFLDYFSFYSPNIKFTPDTEILHFSGPIKPWYW